MVLTASICAAKILSLISPSHTTARELDLDPPDRVELFIKLTPAMVGYFAALARATAVRTKHQLLDIHTPFEPNLEKSFALISINP